MYKDVTMEHTTAGLIRDMRKMHIDGASDQELCHRGTEIYDMLEKDMQLASSDENKKKIVRAERRAFEAVIAAIRHGRHQHALDGYDQYVARRANQRI